MDILQSNKEKQRFLAIFFATSESAQCRIANDPSQSNSHEMLSIVKGPETYCIAMWERFRSLPGGINSGESEYSVVQLWGG